MRISKRFLLNLFTLAITVLGIEGIGRIAYWTYTETPYDARHLEGKLENTEVKPALPEWLAPQIQHPYLGAIYPSHHFETNLPTPNHDARFTVALFGGSVAFNSRELIKLALERHFKNNGIDINWHLALYAVPGYKQPQQLLALTYAAALGKRFDIIINIDGYNEAVLSLDENYDRGVSPFYPRLWDLRAADNEALAAGKLKIRRLRERFLLAKDWIDSNVLRHSALAGLTYRVFLEYTEKRIRKITASLALRQRPDNLEQAGPWKDYPSVAAAGNAVVDTWFKSSVLMSMIAKQLGSEYFHFLQPSQYLDGSKELTEEELRFAYEKQSKRNSYIDLVYPVMQSRGPELLANGIRFFDLTQIFSLTTQTVYSDVCCHLNDAGKTIMVNRVVEDIVINTRSRILK